jgi:hypothetical protein
LLQSNRFPLPSRGSRPKRKSGREPTGQDPVPSSKL